MSDMSRAYRNKDGDRKHKGVLRRNLRSSANRFAASVKEKVSTLEDSVRRRHPFSPLSDNSPNTTIVGTDEISYIDGRRYKFSEGGIMRTPDASPSPWNVTANSMRTKARLRKRFQLGAPNDKQERNLKERLAKQLARCRIWQHSSPIAGRRICRNGKRELQPDDEQSLETSRKENESPELLAVRRVSSSKLLRKHLF